MISLFLILAIVGIYLQVGNFDFVNWDDGLYLTENAHVQKGLSVEGVIWAFTTSHAGNWHPLTWLSHMLDFELYGLNPAGHHYTNIAFHIANTLLLFFILSRMTGALWKSAFVAALFAVHPLHVESVAWISERKDVLSTFLGLLMIGAYYHYIKAPHFKNYLLVIIFFSLGLLAKPMIVTFPFILLLLDFWPLKRFHNKADNLLQSERITHLGIKGNFPLIIEKIPLFILSIASCILTFMVQKSGGAVVPLKVLPLKTRIANALSSYVSYILKAIWPHKLAYYYPYPINTFSMWQICGTILLIISIIIGTMYLSRKYPYMLVGLFWYIGSLVPVIGLVQITNQAMADRYTYISLIGFFIIVVWGVPDILKTWQYRKRFLCVSGAIILSLLISRAFFQTRHWKNSITLFENGVNVTTENNFHALNNLATALVDKGRYDEAFLYMSRALKMDPQRKDVRMNYANLLFLKGKPDNAISQYREMLQVDSDNADAHYNLACVLSSQNKLNEAVTHYNETLRIDPEYAKAHYNLGGICLNQGKIAEAFMHYAEVTKIKPDYVQAYNKLGLILFRQGKFYKAKVLLSKAIQIDPNYSEAQTNIDIVQNTILSR